MGKTDINTHIGKDEIIGNVAAPNQPTCISESCTKIEKNCVRKSKFYSLFLALTKTQIKVIVTVVIIISFILFIIGIFRFK